MGRAEKREESARTGFDFEYATRIFDSPLVEEEDRRRDYRDRRIVVTGTIEDNHLRCGVHIAG